MSILLYCTTTYILNSKRGIYEMVEAHMKQLSHINQVAHETKVKSADTSTDLHMRSLQVEGSEM